ncbi:MAG TPA: hypothetical protein VGO47_05800 [Chlamydiales bacterium]|nr:hypothetical protein [Chlamydiales bacterium]
MLALGTASLTLLARERPLPDAAHIAGLAILYRHSSVFTFLVIMFGFARVPSVHQPGQRPPLLYNGPYYMRSDYEWWKNAATLTRTFWLVPVVMY